METKSHRKLPTIARIKAKNAMKGPMNARALGLESPLKKPEKGNELDLV
jgi:hypothetical protein